MHFRDIRSTLRVATGPSVEPVTVADLRDWLHSDASETTDRLTAMIAAARELVEMRRHCCLITQTWTLTMDCFPDWEIELRRCPVAAVTSVAYLDNDGASQTLSSSLYRLSTGSYPGILTPAYGQVWPTTRDVSDAVTVTFTAGYGGTAASVPEMAKTAIKMVAGEWFETGANVMAGSHFVPPNGFDTLIQSVGWDGYR